MLTKALSKTGHELPAFITPDGVPRLLATIPSGRMCATPFASANPIIPRADWRPVQRRRSVVPILDQGQHGSCTGHGTCTALMLARDEAGMTFELLSPTFIYAQINGGMDAGSNPGDAATLLTSVGTCLMEQCGEDEIMKGEIAQSAYETAKRFRVPEGSIYQCTNWDEIVSAFLLGFTIFDTVAVGGGFNSLDSDGVAPVDSGAMGNHCVAVGEELKQDSHGRWLLKKRNSWTMSWGLDGCYFAVEGHYANQPQMEAYALRYPGDDPSDPSNPPILVA